MARYKNTGSMPLDYSGSGGPFVEPGQEFEHEIPPAMRDAHLEAGNITAVSLPPMTPLRSNVSVGESSFEIDLGEHDKD